MFSLPMLLKKKSEILRCAHNDTGASSKVTQDGKDRLTAQDMVCYLASQHYALPQVRLARR
jgi:hypothetical protein